MGYRRLILITLCLLASKTFGCGFYPRAEELRYNFLKPEYIYPNSGDYFFYTMNMYSYGGEENVSNMFEENCLLWMDALNDKFIYDDVYNAIYVLSSNELKSTASNNAVVNALHTEAYKNHLNYLLFAKSISHLNTSNYYTEWEYDEKMYAKYSKERKKAISKALKLAAKESNDQLKRRYAHLAIRLAFYNSNSKQVDAIYSKFFTENNYKDAIDYWALYFKLQFQETSPENVIKYCQVFLNSKEKRPAIAQQLEYVDFNGLEEITKTNEELIALCFYRGCTDAYTDNYFINKIAELNPAHPCLDFLILREINKIEHKKMTTNYLNYEGVQYEGYFDNAADAISSISSTTVKATDNAIELLEIMNAIDGKRVSNKSWWKLMMNYTTFLANQKLSSQELLKQSKDQSLSPVQRKFCEKMFLLNVFANDEDSDLRNQDVRSLLMKTEHYTDQKLLIALAKELEKHEHLNTSAVMFSNVNKSFSDESMGGYWRNDMLTTTIDADYYYSYFQYVDATFSTFHVQQLIHYLEKYKMSDEFDQKFYASIISDANRMYDMLGTKYLRKEDLKSAYSALSQVESGIWKSEDYAYKMYIHDDPFNNDFYYKTDPRHQKELAKTYTKPEILKELMTLIDVVNNSTGDKKAKAAYKVANCYRNMTYYGNAWMMKRYFWSAYPNQRGFEDDDEYYACLNAQKYYKIAYENASTKEFKILALRMQGLCKNYEMLDQLESYYYSEEEMEMVEKLNPVYQQLRSKYQDFSYTIGSCVGFSNMYKSIE